jgi:hypothetical protein
MVVSLVCCLKFVRNPTIYVLNSMINLVIIFSLILSFSILLLLSGTVHPNPGPQQISMSIAHLNARSLNIADKFNEILATDFI